MLNRRWGLGLFILLLAWIYAPAVFWMVDRWRAADSYYAHGPLIPLVSGLLLWWRRDQWTRLPAASSPWGFRLIWAGLLLQVFSALWRVYFTSAVSFLPVLTGLVLVFGGRRLLSQVWFPIAFLIFMIPLPLAAIANLSLQLKLFAAGASSQILFWMGIPTLQEGSILYLPHSTVLVEDLCSGLRSLISLIALGVLCTYLLKAVWWKRATLLLATVPVAISANIVRITVVCLVSELYGAQMASGAFHDIMGFVSFGLAYGGLALLGAWLR